MGNRWLPGMWVTFHEKRGKEKTGQEKKRKRLYFYTFVHRKWKIKPQKRGNQLKSGSLTCLGYRAVSETIKSEKCLIFSEKKTHKN